MKMGLIGKLCSLVVLIFFMISCGGGGGGDSEDYPDNCEIVINADGPGFLKVVNNTSGHILVMLPEYAFGANVRPYVCELYGLAIGYRQVEISQCTDDNCDNWTSTQYPTVNIQSGIAHEIIVNEDFFQEVNKKPDYSTDCEDFIEQDSYSGDCLSRPSGSVCAQFWDGYIYLIYDSVLDGGTAGTCNGNEISYALGKYSVYYHIENTNYVKETPR